MMRIARMTRLAARPRRRALVLLPGAASAAVCSPLNCAASQFTVGNGTMLAYRHSALGPVSVSSLRTGKVLHRVPGGFSGGTLLVHQRPASRFVVRPPVRRRSRLGAPPVEDSARGGLAGRDACGRFPSRAGWSDHAGRGEPLGGANVRSSGPAMGLRRAARRQPVSRAVSARRRVPGALLDLRTGKLASESAEGSARVGHDLGRAVLAARVARTGTCCSRCTSLERRRDGARARSRAREGALHRPARHRRLPVRVDLGDGAFPWRADALGGQPRLRPRGRRSTSRRVGCDSAFAFELPYWNRATGTRAALRGDGKRAALANGEEVAELALDRA